MPRYDQCDHTCTVDCGHCKGQGPPPALPLTSEDLELLYDVAMGHVYRIVQKTATYDVNIRPEARHRCTRGTNRLSAAGLIELGPADRFGPRWQRTAAGKEIDLNDPAAADSPFPIVPVLADEVADDVAAWWAAGEAERSADRLGYGIVDSTAVESGRTELP